MPREGSRCVRARGMGGRRRGCQATWSSSTLTRECFRAAMPGATLSSIRGRLPRPRNAQPRLGSHEEPRPFPRSERGSERSSSVGNVALRRAVPGPRHPLPRPPGGHVTFLGAEEGQRPGMLGAARPVGAAGAQEVGRGHLKKEGKRKGPESGAGEGVPTGPALVACPPARRPPILRR